MKAGVGKASFNVISGANMFPGMEKHEQMQIGIKNILVAEKLLKNPA